MSNETETQWQVTPTYDDVARWLVKEDYQEGLDWQGKLVDAFLMDNDGAYRVSYVIELTSEPPKGREKVTSGKGPKAVEIEIAKGDLVAFGEKAHMRMTKAFRGCRLGDEIRFRCVGAKDTGAPSPMMLFKTATRQGKVPGIIVQVKLADDFKAGRRNDPWDGSEAMSNPPPRQDEIPF